MTVKANKIAAGVEAEKTNELFQNLAKAINMKPDNDDLIKKTLKKLKSEGDKVEKPRETNLVPSKRSNNLALISLYVCMLG